MANKKNSYAQQAKKNELMKVLKGEADGKGKAGTSALITLKDLALVVLGGGVIGSVSGKLALPVGFVLTGAGHYTNSKLLQLLGVGTMAANSFSKAGTVNGMDGLDGVKERLLAYKESMKEKFFLDKLSTKKDTTTSGVGELQYFSYPGSNNDLAALDDIEQQLAQSALEFQGSRTGEDYEMGLLDLEEAMY